MKLLNEVAVITGAGSGMGRAMARLFVSEGAKVVAADIVPKGVEELISECGDLPGEIVYCKADVSKRAEVEAMLDFAVEKFGNLDILVNNAGIMDNMMPVGEVSDELWDRVMNINLKGVMFACRRAVDIMLGQSAGGRIINIASLGGLQGCRAGAAYTASKFAVVGLTRNIGYMYAAKGIRCNAICPGAVETNIGTGMREPSELGMERALGGINLNPRIGASGEIANVALFLASNDSSIINGAVITADSGWSAY